MQKVRPDEDLPLRKEKTLLGEEVAGIWGLETEWRELGSQIRDVEQGRKDVEGAGNVCPYLLYGNARVIILGDL